MEALTYRYGKCGWDHGDTSKRYFLYICLLILDAMIMWNTYTLQSNRQSEKIFFIVIKKN